MGEEVGVNEDGRIPASTSTLALLVGLMKSYKHSMTTRSIDMNKSICDYGIGCPSTVPSDEGSDLLYGPNDHAVLLGSVLITRPSIKTFGINLHTSKENLCLGPPPST